MNSGLIGFPAGRPAPRSKTFIFYADDVPGTSASNRLSTACTFEKPDGQFTMSSWILFGGGGGGGSGRRGGNNDNSSGGGGGGGAGFAVYDIPFAALSDSMTVGVGVGGAGGAALSSTSNGAAGQNGGHSYVTLGQPTLAALGSFPTTPTFAVGGGDGGSGGTTTTGGGGTGGVVVGNNSGFFGWDGGTGGVGDETTSNTSPAQLPSTIGTNERWRGASAGGGAGGCNGSDVKSIGMAGGILWLVPGGVGGNTGAGNKHGADGRDCYIAKPSSNGGGHLGGGTGGGGGEGGQSGQTAGDGGRGGFAGGGGGGGGGASGTTSTSGAGGRGGHGVVVVTFF